MSIKERAQLDFFSHDAQRYWEGISRKKISKIKFSGSVTFLWDGTRLLEEITYDDLGRIQKTKKQSRGPKKQGQLLHLLHNHTISGPRALLLRGLGKKKGQPWHQHARVRTRWLRPSGAGSCSLKSPSQSAAWPHFLGISTSLSSVHNPE